MNYEIAVHFGQYPARKIRVLREDRDHDTTSTLACQSLAVTGAARLLRHSAKRRQLGSSGNT